MTNNSTNKSAHTPGPWSFCTVDYGSMTGAAAGYVRGDKYPFDAIWSEGVNRPVCVAQDASSYMASFDFPNEADARLIAAAPDLLACVEAALNMVDGDGTPPDWDYLRSVLAALTPPLPRRRRTQDERPD
jgi:hypothetical protein